MRRDNRYRYNRGILLYNKTDYILMNLERIAESETWNVARISYDRQADRGRDVTENRPQGATSFEHCRVLSLRILTVYVSLIGAFSRSSSQKRFNDIKRTVRRRWDRN